MICDHPDVSFDRSICPEPCGAMHNFCTECGECLDPCPWKAERQREEDEAWDEFGPMGLAELYAKRDKARIRELEASVDWFRLNLADRDAEVARLRQGLAGRDAGAADLATRVYAIAHDLPDGVDPVDSEHDAHLVERIMESLARVEAESEANPDPNPLPTPTCASCGRRLPDPGNLNDDHAPGDVLEQAAQALLIDLKLQPGLDGYLGPKILPNEFWVTLTNKQVDDLARLHVKDRFRELYGPIEDSE